MPFQSLSQSLPRMLDALQQQTDVRLPSWAHQVQEGDGDADSNAAAQAEGSAQLWL